MSKTNLAYLKIASACRAVGIVLFILLSATMPVHAGDAAYQESPRIESTDCPMSVPDSYSVECGYLTVPEDRSLPDSPTLRLAVGIMRSPSENPLPDPIIILHGGPGLGMLNGLSWLANFFRPELEQRDVIFYDQRGSGLSQPALHCPEMDDLGYQALTQNLSLKALAEYHAQAARACQNRLRADGIRLAAYTTADSTTDFDDLRRALGYEQVNLYGISYGTRLALTIMRDHPEVIRSVFLTGVYMPPEGKFLSSLTPNAANTFETLFALCAADDECSRAYPNLRQVFLETVDQLNAEPLSFPVKNPVTGESDKGQLNGLAFTGLLYRLLYDPVYVPIIPRLIYEIHAGRADFLPGLLIFSGAIDEPRNFGSGMNQSIYCHDEAPFTSRDAIEAGMAEVDPRLYGHYHWDVSPFAFIEFCDEWDSRPVDPVENQAVHSDIPTLIVAGELDPAAPPIHSQLIAQNLSKHYLYVIKGGGHLTLQLPCVSGIVTAFYNDPSMEPDSTCLQTLAPDYLTDGEFYPTGMFLRITTEITYNSPAFHFNRILIGVFILYFVVAFFVGLANLWRTRRQAVSRQDQLTTGLLIILSLGSCLYLIGLFQAINHTAFFDYGRMFFGVDPKDAIYLFAPYGLALLTLVILVLSRSSRGMGQSSRQRLWPSLTAIVSIVLLIYLAYWGVFAT